MWDINVKIAQLKELIESKISQPYLEQSIPAPLIDEDKLLLLYTMFSGLQIPEETLDKYLLTIMLVQIALDTHETVTSEKVDEEAMKERQLTVLAGDYYSGLYYYILADLDNVLMIQALAMGIKEVNEYKIRLYQKEADQIENMIYNLKMIESSIFSKMADFFQLGSWSEIVSTTLLLKRLLKERECFLKLENSLVFEILAGTLFQRNSKLDKLDTEQETYLLFVWDRYIEYTKETLDKLLNAHPSGSIELQKRIHSLFTHYNFSVNKVAEEG